MGNLVASAIIGPERIRRAIVFDKRLTFASDERIGVSAKARVDVEEFVRQALQFFIRFA